MKKFSWKLLFLGKSSLLRETDEIIKKRIENNGSLRLGLLAILIVSFGIIILYNISAAWLVAILSLLYLGDLNSAVRQDKILLEIREMRGEDNGD